MTSDRYYIFNVIILAIFLSTAGICERLVKNFPDLLGDVVIAVLYILIIIIGLLLLGKLKEEADDNKIEE